MATSNLITFTESIAWQAKQLTTTDTSTYLSEDTAWASANSRGLLKVVDPLGNTTHENTTKATPDISAGGGNFVLNMPLDGSVKNI